MNNKLNEFIIKHNDFYSKLSSDDKHLISNLDEYGDLNPSLMFHLLRSFSDEEKYVYLYLGKKENITYFYRCFYEINQLAEMYFDIKSGEIIIFKDVNDYNLQYKFIYG